LYCSLESALHTSRSRPRNKRKWRLQRICRVPQLVDGILIKLENDKLLHQEDSPRKRYVLYCIVLYWRRGRVGPDWSQLSELAPQTIRGVACLLCSALFSYFAFVAGDFQRRPTCPTPRRRSLATAYPTCRTN
jgi:hypothetical protein